MAGTKNFDKKKIYDFSKNPKKVRFEGQNLFISIYWLLLLYYFIKIYKILYTDIGIKSMKKVQNTTEHGNGMVGFEVGL